MESKEKTGMTVWHNEVNPYNPTGYQPIYLCFDRKLGESLGYIDGQEVTREQYDLLATTLTATITTIPDKEQHKDTQWKHPQ